MVIPVLICFYRTIHALMCLKITHWCYLPGTIKHGCMLMWDFSTCGFPGLGY